MFERIYTDSTQSPRSRVTQLISNPAMSRFMQSDRQQNGQCPDKNVVYCILQNVYLLLFCVSLRYAQFRVHTINHGLYPFPVYEYRVYPLLSESLSSALVRNAPHQ